METPVSFDSNSRMAAGSVFGDTGDQLPALMSVANLKPNQLSRHFFFAMMAAALVSAEPISQFIRIHFQHFTNPCQTTGVGVSCGEPIQSILPPQLPFLMRSLFRGYDIAKSLKQNAQSQITQRRIRLLGLRVQALTF